MSSVTIAGVVKAYGDRRVLDAVDLHVADGSITSVLGASGCGKTTLLRIVAGFVRADAGSVTLGERVVEDGRTAVAPDRRGVGYVPQEGALFPHLDVAGNIMFGIPRGERTTSRLGELLELAELPADLAHRQPHQLSGGQQQRVAIARALAPAPRVILLDEPFSSLDAALRISAGKAVTRVLRHAGATALIVTHDQGEALSLADQVAVMRAGRFVQVDSPAGIYERPADAETAEFVGGASMIAAEVSGGIARCVAGAIPVAAADGRVRVLIRPEQVLLGPAAGAAVVGQVTEVGFYGAQVVVTLALADGTPLTARAPSARTPRPGDEVGVVIEGSAVTFGDES
ncbi:ABC transporter ATP-binding protein [Nocardioides marmoriginsengisoli]|uniref:ABC-type quaternary amine transporter n=1 Tax=Nocardioides marmoriginsengisoli TaxID=661483 RepID=A0A3N0CLI2_9ACTN|nr:ABC transporter ATP-binding protein [Nocardioides marmoriginsengisoli]RNL64317.1 ABC transporter ATP-binding protein [Nocardioides marmoriginsengisoli]